MFDIGKYLNPYMIMIMRMRKEKIWRYEKMQYTYCPKKTPNHWGVVGIGAENCPICGTKTIVKE